MRPPLLEEDSDFLSPSQRTVVRDLLHSSQPNAIRGALLALTNIGGNADLPALRRLASGRSTVADDPLLAREAQETIARIEERLALQTQTAILLRAASQPDSGAGQLLRPTIPAPNKTETEQLLRAGRSPNEAEP